jgi:hypothetical protein
MSSSVGGKFQDHYAVLGIETNADSETIQAAYSKLARKCAETGDKSKLDALNQAFEVLSDPGLRASFDKVKGVDHETGDPKFTGVEFFHRLTQSALLRSAVLCILYDRRQINSFKPGLSMRHIEGMLQAPSEELNFAVWYLKKRSLVVVDDKSNMEITVDGMDFLEQNRPDVESVMPLFKQDAHAKPPSQPEKRPIVAETKTGEPVLNALNRALQRASVSYDAQPRDPLQVK